MRIQQITVLIAALIAMALSVQPTVSAQQLRFSGDIKIVPPQRLDEATQNYITLETLVAMTGGDLFVYFRIVSPGSNFADFLAANPNLGGIDMTSPVDAGTIFVIPRPKPMKTDE